MCRSISPLVNAGRKPRLGTAGTGTTSATTPLLAVGGAACNGHNPPQYLNAQFNTVEVQESAGLWHETADDDVLAARSGAELHCRVSVGNIAEAAWLAPAAGESGSQVGRVYLSCRYASGKSIDVPIAANAAYLADAEVANFVLPQPAGPRVSLTLQMVVARTDAQGKVLRIPFGQQRHVTFRIVE